MEIATALFTTETERIIAFIAGAILWSAQIMLIRDVWRQAIHISILSWVGWGLLMGTGVLSQIVESGWEWNQMGLLLSAVGCFCIAGAAVWKWHFRLERADRWYLILGLLCMIVYITSKDPWITTVFAILADFIVGVPTLIAAYQHPASQRTHAWMVGGISWTLTLLVCIGHDWLYALFPIYLWIYNWAMVVLTRRRAEKII